MRSEPLPAVIRLAPALTILLLVGPLAAGLLGVLIVAGGGVEAFSAGIGLGGAVQAVFAAPGILRSLAVPLVAALATTAVALGVTFLVMAAFYGTRAFAVLRQLVAPLLSVPHAAAAVGLAFLIAPSGLVARLVSPGLTGWVRPPDALIVHDPLGLSMMAGLAAKEMPFLMLVALAGLSGLQPGRASALMRSLGYGRLRGFWVALAPQLYRQIRLPVFAVIAYASAQVDVALVLGPTTPPPFSLRILEWAQDPDLGQRQVAAAAALVQLALTAFAGLCWMAGERLMAALWRRAAMSGRRFHRDGGLRALALGLGLLPVLSVGGGLLALALWSVSGPWRFPEALPVRFTLAAWQRFAASLDESLVPTLLIAGLASMAALVLVVLCLAFETTRGMKSLSSRGLVVLYLPLLVPQVAFLFGLQILAIVLHLDGTLLGVAAVHLLFVLPYVYLSLAGPWRRVDPRFDTTAASLGLTPLRRLLRVRLPLLTAPLLTAFAIGLAVSIGQYLPTLMIGAGRIQTITTETLALSSGGDRRLLGAAALLQALLPFLGFALALVLPGLLFRNRRGMTA